MSAFDGFPPQLFTFFEGLEKDNSKEYWTAHKSIWDKSVREPMLALFAELDDEFPALRLFRPNRDLRFSTDKSPYKLWVGGVSDSGGGGASYYLRVQASGLATGCGAMAMAPDQLVRFRASIDDDSSGRRFADLTTELAARSLPVTCGAEPPLKMVPRGYPKDHPRAEYLRWKGAVVITECRRSDWMHTPLALDRIRDIWRAAQPLEQWIAAHVGPTGTQPRKRAGSAR
ncbi:DUF2461 domain-containing protein [Nocardia sp. NPDC051321]|uniref:DUF2461 domain-containing protein n=1 Tax=Nocardia sp. NPDC051321 TaxID=3364323 RepID=UPI0037A847FB